MIQVDDQMKRMLSTLSVTESFKKPKIGLSNLEFCSNKPKSGGSVFVNNNLINTCTIGYFLFSMWVAWRFEPLEFLDNDLSQYLYQIINKIKNKDYNETKLLWTINELKMSPIMNLDVFWVIDKWGNENEMYVHCFFLPFQEHTQTRTCSSSCERNNSQQIKQYICFNSDNNNNVILFANEMCHLCNSLASLAIRLSRNPFIIIKEAAFDFNPHHLRGVLPYPSY